MGLLSPLKKLGGWLVGDGNMPGTKETRKLGYDPEQVAGAAAIDLAATVSPNVQKELMLGGVAILGIVLLLRQPRRGGS